MPLIDAFRHTLGGERLAEATAEYKARVSELGKMRSMRIEDKQPLIGAFSLYKKKTFDGRRKLKNVSGNLALLANVAVHAHMIVPTLPDVNRKHHFSALLNPDGPFRPTLLEWKTAAQLARSNHAELAWGNPGRQGPEFVARSQGVEWDVECKHLTDMALQAVGEKELGDLAEGIVQAVIAHGLTGSLELKLPANITTAWKPDMAAIADRARSGLAQGVVLLNLGQELVLTGVLSPRNELRLPHSMWVADLESRKTETSQLFGYAVRDGIYAMDSVDLMVEVPLKTRDILRQDLWEKKFKKAAEQCGAQRGAFLSFEWHGLDDPCLFEHDPLFQDLIAQTFDEYRHVAAISLRCGPPPVRADGQVDFSVEAYLAKSKVTDYLDVARLIAFDR